MKSRSRNYYKYKMIRNVLNQIEDEIEDDWFDFVLKLGVIGYGLLMAGMVIFTGLVAIILIGIVIVMTFTIGF